MRKLSRRLQPTIPETSIRTVWQLGAALLDYPTPGLLADLDRIESALGGLPPVLGAPLVRFATHLRCCDLRSLQEEYVATFDHTRRCALYLTYFAYGDTRR